MREFELGRDFMSVPADDIPRHEWYYPDYPEEQETEIAPVFSETNLYFRMTKDDARFILAVVDEYRAIIEELGPEEVRKILERKRPR